MSPLRRSSHRRPIRLLLLPLGAAAALMAAACGSDSDMSAPVAGTAASQAPSAADAGSRPGEGITIGFVAVTNCANPTICAVLDGVKAEAEAAGATATVLEWSGASGSNPVDAMISNVDQLIAQKVDAIAVWPVDSGAVKAPIARAVAAGIPVFLFDEPVAADTDVVSAVAQGRELQAKQSAEYICAARPDGGTVLYGDYGLPIGTLQFLAAKFKENIERCSGGKLKVAVYQNATDDVSGARKTAEPALLSNRDTVAIAGYNDPTSVGGSQAAQSLNVRDKLVIAGYNLAPDGVEALEGGRLDVSWDYQPVVMGQLITKQMINYVNGTEKAPPKVTVVWPKCYDRSTIADAPGNEALLERVKQGEDLSTLDPALVQTGDAIPVPGDDLPSCAAPAAS